MRPMLPEKYSPHSQVNAIHAARAKAQPHTHTRAVDKRAYVRVYAHGIRKRLPGSPMVHCLSRQFARFMRGFNEVIGLAPVLLTF